MKAKTKTWAQRIKEARARGWFTSRDKDRAWSWRTCAVGEALPDHIAASGEVSGVWILKPELRHSYISDAGCAFAEAVTDSRIKDAAACYRVVRAEAKKFKASL